MNILIVEDDLILADQIISTFSQYALVNNIKHLISYEDFLKYTGDIILYDIVLIDLILSNNNYINNGFDIIDHIRILNKQTPIIVMSGVSDLKTLEKAFKKGANDYIIKPFRPKELKIRVFKWFQYYIGNTYYFYNDLLHYHELSYSVGQNQFYFLGQTLLLNKQSKQLLLLLFLHAEELVVSDYLCRKIWCDREEKKGYGERNFRILILRLRKKMYIYGDLGYRITTIRGEGYILKKSYNLV